MGRVSIDAYHLGLAAFAGLPDFDFGSDFDVDLGADARLRFRVPLVGGCSESGMWSELMVPSQAHRSPEGSGGTAANCYTPSVTKRAESVTLDDDVQEDLRKLAERSGRPLDVLANAALREYVRYESHVGASIERGLADVEAGRVRTTEDVLLCLQEQRRIRSRG